MNGRIFALGGVLWAGACGVEPSAAPRPDAAPAGPALRPVDASPASAPAQPSTVPSAPADGGAFVDAPPGPGDDPSAASLARPAELAGAASGSARAVKLPAARSSDAELRMLTRARRLLRAAPARSLALTVDHQRAFEAPHHAERREIIAMEALLRLGRGDEARARARAFYTAFPRSPDIARVRALVAGAP